MQHEVAPGVHFKSICPLEAEDDRVGVDVRAQHEVVLELAAGTVIDEVDAGVDAFVSHLGIRRHVRSPLCGIIADEVVRLPGRLLLSAHARLGVGAHESHAHHGLGTLCWPARGRVESKDCLRRCEKEDVAVSAGDELDLWIRLPAIGLEVQR